MDLLHVNTASTVTGALQLWMQQRLFGRDNCNENSDTTKAIKNIENVEIKSRATVT